jgi:hypothetical protein
MIHSVELSARMYQLYFLKMTLKRVKDVGVTCSLKKVVTC